MCCGTKRMALVAAGASVRTMNMTGGESAHEEAGRDELVNLLYYGHAPVNIRGPVTGQLYQFSSENSVLAVDGRDAVSMLRTRLFRQVR